MDVKVRAEASQSGIEWTIDGKKPRDSVINVARKSGSKTLDFKLDDKTGLSLRFNQRDPIWAHESEDGACPTGGIDTDQITIESCDDKKLSILDANTGCARTLHYRLNFLDRDGQGVDVDPIIKNGGNI